MKDARDDIIKVMLVDDMRGARTGFMMMLTTIRTSSSAHRPRTAPKQSNSYGNHRSNCLT